MSTTALTKAPGEVAVYDAAEIRRLLIPANQPQPSNEEVEYFVRVCLDAGLNPFLKEVYLVKIGDNPAAIIPAAIAYEQRAEAFPEYDGYEAGLLVMGDSHLVAERQGAAVYPGEKMGVNIVGGYARVFRKDRSRPYYLSVGFWESVVLTREGKPNKFWDKQPGYQLRLSALRKCLREAFPSRYPEAVFGQGQQDYETYEPNIPPESFRGNKETRWKTFYGKLSSLGVTHNQAQEIVEQATGQGCASLDVWVNTHDGGLERLYEIIVSHVRTKAVEQDKDDLYGNQRQLERQAAADNAARSEVLPSAVAGPPFQGQGPVPPSTDPKPNTLPAPGPTIPRMPSQDEATTFWGWARQNGYTSQNIGKALGKPIEDVLKDGRTFPQIQRYCELLLDGRLPQDAWKLALEGK